MAERTVLLTANPPADYTFVTVDAETLEVLERRPGPPARGVCKDGNRLWFLVGQNDAMHLAVADLVPDGDRGVRVSDLKLMDYTVPGGHGLVKVGDRLLAVSSMTNEVYVMREDGGLDHTFWFTPYAGFDSSHLNDLCLDGTDLLISMFVWHRPQICQTKWRDLPAVGIVIRLKSPYPLELITVEASGLNQPHSVTRHNGTTWVCSSKSEELWKDGKPLGFVIGSGGYLRGLAITDSSVYTAISSRRLEGHEQGWAEVVRLSLHGEVIVRRWIAGIREVYGVCVI